jgi:ActR/RegA family two-component response regulator
MNASDSGPRRPMLLSIVELGGYPDFRALYERAGYAVTSAASTRKALALMKTLRPRVVVAEFNFQSDFRDRTSSLESLLAAVQTLPDVRVIVFYEKEFAHQLARVSARFSIHAALEFPIDEERLLAALP